MGSEMCIRDRRIFSVTGFKALLDDDPWWLAPLAIIVVVLIVVAWSFLAR